MSPLGIHNSTDIGLHRNRDSSLRSFALLLKFEKAGRMNVYDVLISYIYQTYLCYRDEFSMYTTICPWSTTRLYAWIDM